MSKTAVIQRLEKRQLKKSIPDFRVGDTIKVHTRIIEGEKERIQVFIGTVIARTGGGLSETFSLHRVAYGEGMERVFPLHSPRIAKIEVVKQGQVRRAKLYYLRGTFGKAAKVKARLTKRREYVKKQDIAPVVEKIKENVAETVNVEVQKEQSTGDKATQSENSPAS